MSGPLLVVALLCFSVIRGAQLDAASERDLQPKDLPSERQIAQIGETITAGDWRFRVESVTNPGQPASMNDEEPIGQWVEVQLTIENLGSRNVGLYPYDFVLRTNDGTITYDPSPSGSKVASQIPPGLPYQATLLFDVNPSHREVVLWLVVARQGVKLDL
ncbi:MAG: DUF4352 domain-containing protein [Chloroflexi bacterium]|nr:DUF4352 domain-containing protein [Chloroflexota bacterium]